MQWIDEREEGARIRTKFYYKKTLTGYTTCDKWKKEVEEMQKKCEKAEKDFRDKVEKEEESKRLQAKITEIDRLKSAPPRVVMKADLSDVFDHSMQHVKATSLNTLKALQRKANKWLSSVSEHVAELEACHVCLKKMYSDWICVERKRKRERE